MGNIMDGKIPHQYWDAYRISKSGEIYSAYSDNIIKQATNSAGYKMVYLTKYDRPSVHKIGPKERKWQMVHRLVAQVYVPNPMNLPEVNHKDGNKLNNHYTNLEWCDHSTNIRHSFEVLGRKMPTGKDHWMFGKTQSDATKSLMSASKLGDKHPKFKGYYVSPTGAKYGSPALAEAETHINAGSVRRWSKVGKNGWSFELVHRTKKS